MATFSSPGRSKNWFNKNRDFSIQTFENEFGTQNIFKVSLSKIKPSCRELDKIIMGEILGLTEEEQLEVYRAVIDLVKSRIEKAKSVKNNNKTKTKNASGFMIF